MSHDELLPLRRLGREFGQGGHVQPFTVLQRQMNRLFDDFFGEFAMRPFEGWTSPETGFVPRINVVKKEQEIEVTAELAGLDEKDVEVILEDGRLTLRGEKKMQTEEKTGHYYHRESRWGSFCRSVELECEVDAQRAGAFFRNGVLTVRLPRMEPEKSQSKRIEVKTG